MRNVTVGSGFPALQGHLHIVEDKILVRDYTGSVHGRRIVNRVRGKTAKFCGEQRRAGRTKRPPLSV